MNIHTWKPIAPAGVLHQLYAVDGLSMRMIAQRFGCSQKAVRTSLRRAGIPSFPAKARHTKREKCYAWKADLASYASLHLRVAKERGRPRHCDVCGKDDQLAQYEWANLTGRYHDPSDYKRMCLSCHRKHDKTILNIPVEYRRRKTGA